ncbi:hypothetical protein HMN09_00931800 [Mycena chlorophos]|uniref:DUF6533 domain-containing protein n=1 Tax=Mycena chlorophos TaxID=658473 RepID=A0A8H6SKS2_MYCCL|nr:hypothetical protein HMN09_00931800 [Mycena chlorophos]
MALPEVILTGLHDIETIRYAQLASSAIIVFDHIITFDEEVKLIWKSSWSMGKALFVINRYYTLVSVVINNYALFSPVPLTDSVRLAFLKWQGWTGLFTCVVAQIILQMRLYALYYLNKRVLALMLTLFVISTASAGAIMGTVLSWIVATSHPIPIPALDVNFCVPVSGIPRWFFVYWVPMLSFEALLCVLALYRGFQTFRASGTLYQSGRHLVGILIRDSVLYFLVMFASYFTNLLMWSLARTSLLEVPIAFSVAFSCVLCNRIVLNVREVKSELDSSAEAIGQQRRKTTTGSDSIGSISTSLALDSRLYYADSEHAREHHDSSLTGTELVSSAADEDATSAYSPRLVSLPSPRLTDIEMARLRTMRVDDRYVQELESQSGVYEHAQETGYAQFVVL